MDQESTICASNSQSDRPLSARDELMYRGAFVVPKRPLSVRWFVYFLMKGDEVIYIGKSKAIDSRVRHHRSQWRFTDALAIEVDAEFASDLEALFIDKFQPKKNKVYTNKRYSRSGKCFARNWKRLATLSESGMSLPPLRTEAHLPPPKDRDNPAAG